MEDDLIGSLSRSRARVCIKYTQRRDVRARGARSREALIVRAVRRRQCWSWLRQVTNLWPFYVASPVRERNT